MPRLDSRAAKKPTKPSTTTRRSQSSVRNIGPKRKSFLPSLGKVNPLNVSQQQELFFQNSCLTNPILSYSYPNQKSEYLSKFQPSSTYLQQAIHILESCLAEFGSESNYFRSDGGELLDQGQTINAIQTYVSELGLTGIVDIVFSEQAIAPAACSYNSKTKKGQVTISLPIIYRKNRIGGAMDHEIGTHLIRTLNETKQVWYKKRDKFNLKPFLETEEGLATLHTVIRLAMNRNKKPYLWRSALHYYTSYQSSQMNFVDLFSHMERYIDDPGQRFKEVLRVKRGLEDTSQIGGCYKDQVYLSGAIKILQKRQEINFDDFYMGKLSLDDYFRDDIRDKITKEKTVLPTFLKDKEEYMRALDYIAQINGLD
ncbi:unnamed protein product [Blepharisma stoltei]|uniref:DUF1704 domain-containing protein n=1 Tax=Blepharisma stoltei TaxID=1481888 RepID=A0AAU9K0S7_9CILI|nr:unnamed protein product [Blepharisma stoltei]